MFKVIRSYKKSSERKHESSAAAGQQQQQHSSSRNGHAIYDERNGGSAHYGNGYAGNGHAVGGGGGQMMAVDNRHLSNVHHQAGQGFSESSSYETREHFERKVQRVKKTRGERERSRSARRGDEVSEVLHGSDASSARDALLQWARKVTAGYPRVNVTNFSSSWRDGLAFNAILHRYRPNLIDWNKISDPSVSNRDRLENAFAAAEREFGVHRLLDPEDVDTDNPDEKSLITYVSSLYEALPHLPELSKGNLNDLISRLTRGIGITNEKLDLILQRIEEVEARVDSARPGEIERAVNEIVDDLNALESPIGGFFEDVEELKSHNHPEANDFYQQVFGLHQRRTAYLDRLTNQLLVRLGVRTETLRKENAQRMESIKNASFSRVEECIEWVRVRMTKLTEMEFLEDLETLEEMFEQHKLDNRDIQDFRQNVDECIARQAEVSAEDTYEYCELLRVLESEYQQLRDLSAGRMLDLDSLIAFVRAAQMELVWVSSREELEVTRNWSDIKQLDIPMLTNYYKQLLHEMELREKQYNDVHNQGAALLNQGHPAIHVIEVYLKTMQNQWDWLLALSKCLEEHLRDAMNLKSFMEEAADAEAWMEDQSKRLENNYNKTDFSLEEGERYLRELDEIKEILNKYHGVLMALMERCATISPLWQRGERITRPITVTALCDYSDKDLHIKAGDDVTLLDNSDLIKWHIRDLSGTEGTVPSVVFRIPPPDGKLAAYLQRLLQQFEKLKKLWDKKHRMVRFNMVLNTMKTIQGWDLDTFNAIDPEQRDAIMRALNDDANKLLSELDPNDPLALRLREELRKTNEHFWNLLNASQKPPEPDYSSQYDDKINDLLRKLEEAWRKLNDNVGKPVSRTPEELEKIILGHKQFEDDLQGLDADVANVKELFRQLTNATPTQRVNNERLSSLWEDLWDLSRMYVERIKVLESVLNGMMEVADIVKAHEITLNSFDDLPAALDKLRGHHSQLLEMNMVLQQQQSVIDSLNKNVALLRQHVARTRGNQGSHPDVDRIEEEVQQLNVRWENVGAQVADRLKAAERALQIQMVYRSEYESEIAWLDRVEETINRLRKPEELRPEEYQHQLDLLVAEYAQLQERTEAIENVNREGGKFIREAKGYDSRMGQFNDAIVGIHGHSIREQFRRTKPQPKNGAQIVTEELEALNRRFAQLSSLILERRNNMQVLIQNWKRQKQDEVAEVASSHQTQIVDMLSDLSKFKDTIYTQHLTFSLSSPESALSATRNVQNVKESLDAWRENVKSRLDAVDLLCRESADTMTPEQFAQLREQRNQLAANYDNVVRTVEGVYERLNVIASLLVEFSSQTSSMQSWMTDRTRVAGSLKALSVDPDSLAKATQEARDLIDEVSREESRLKTIGYTVSSIEREIDALYTEAPSIPDRNINSDDVRTTMYRVQDDYSELMKQCQDLLQFQNRVDSLRGDSDQTLRKLDDWLASIESNITDIDDSNQIHVADKVQMLDELNKKASDEDGRLAQAEQATLRWLAAVEGSGVSEEIRRKQQDGVHSRRKRHADALDLLQQRMNSATAELAANEGARDAVARLASWSEEFEKKVRQPTVLPLREDALNELKSSEQQMRSDLERHLAVVDQLETDVAKLPASEELQNTLEESRKRLQRSGSELRGLRDNVNDALSGLQSLMLGGESLSRNCDIVAANLAGITARDATRLEASSADVGLLKSQFEQMNQTAQSLKNIPNATDAERVDLMVAAAGRRVGALASELEQKKHNMETVGRLENQFDDMKERLLEWMGRFDGDLMELGPVSVLRPRLAEQRKQCAAMADRHRQGQPQLEELEQLSMQIAESEPAGGRASSIPRHALDLLSRFKAQEDTLRSRADKINRNEQRAAEVDDAHADLNKWIEAQEKLLAEQSVPLTKEAVQTAVAKLDRIDKNTRQEQRRVEEARLKSRELARSASMEQESAAVNAVNDAVDERWNQLNDNLEASRLAARKAEHLVDGCGQLDKWLGAKGRMLEIMGAPSTEPALARSQIAQLQIIQAEAENEKPTLERLNSIAKEIESAAGPDSAAELVKRMDDLNRKWSSLEEGLAHKEDTVKKADQLGKDIKQLQKDIKREIGDLESGIESAAAMSPSEVDKQLAALDKLKQRFSGLDGMLSDLDQKVVAAEELEVDPASRSEINEQVDQAKKRADELDHKVDNVKRAALSAKDEGDALDHQIDALLSVAREVESEIHQAPPVSADPQRLSEQSAAVEAIYKTLQAKEGDVSLVKAKASDQLKKQHDSVLKAKLDELNKTWTPLLSATKDRRNNLNKISDLVKQFNDMESTLSDRLKEDEKEMESIIAEGDKAAVSDALRSMDTVLGRRLADGEALSGLCARIETAAPGPDANKLRRKADNLVDDCKRMTKKAKSVAAASQKKIDLSDKFDRLLDEARQYAAVQSAELADGADAMNKDRVHAKIGEVESFWARKNREIRTCSEQLKTVSDDAENENIDSSISEVAAEFDSLLAALRAQDALLGEKQSAADRTKEHTNKLSNDVNALYAEISDLEPVARSHDALSAQLSECAGLADSIRQQEEEAKAVEAEWQKALDDDVISQPQWEANRTALDNIDKLLARAHKKLAQRSKKIEQTEAEVSKIDSDAAALSAELDLLRSSEALSSPLDVSDPRTQAELLKQLKEAVKPVGQKVDNFQSECKVLIKSAGPDIDTTELDADLAKVSDSWSSVAAAIAEREMAVDSAVQQMGRYEDAHKALLNWLEETEEMLENQRPPSADAKVAKAQLHAYDVLLKHIEDKEASVKGFTAMIEKIAEMAPSAEEKAALRQKEAGVVKRYSDLLAGAQDRQSRLMEAVDLAERLTEGTVPLTNWLGKAEKRLQGLSNVAADAERMMAQLEAQRQLEEEVYAKGEDVDIVLAIVPMLCALVSVEDANALESQTNQLATRYESLANRTRQMKDLLADVAGQVGDFEHDTNALSEWLDEMEARMLDMDELAIEPDDLLEQSNILTDLAVIVTERDALVSGVLSVGRELSKQTSADEAIALQNRVESLKMRYADMLSVADEKLALLSKALPLSERFHDGFDDVMQWVEAVEEDLLHVDEADIETQAQLIFTMEEDVTRWRPEVEELVAVSNQLQTLSGPERADELYQNTVEMNKRVNQIADKVSRRAERLDLTEKQSRAVLDELEYIVEWLADARERVVMAGPPSIDPEFVKTQLKNQRIMNEDVTANKGRLREVIAEAKKVIRQIGTDGPDSAAGYAQLEEKCELGKDLVDEVASLCMDRTECLERALVLAQQLTAEFEELSNWLDDVDNQLRNSDEITTVTPAAELRKMHEHNLELMASIVAYKPIVDRFEMNVRMMQEVCSDHEAEKLGELAEEVVGKYNDIKDAARSRGQALDGMLDATSGFAERLDNFVQNLQGAADRLRGNDSISADPVVLQNRLAENQAIIDTLRTKEAAYATLKDSAAELLAAAPHGDLAAQDVSGKLDHLEKLWRDILGEAAQRGDFLENVLAKANHFWKELDQCQKAVDDLRVRLDVVEPATGQPEQLQLQQVVLSEVAGDMSSTAPRIAALRQAGEALTAVIPPEEQVMVNTQMDAVQDGWSTITKLFADKNRDLIAAMEDAMSFHGDLAAILAWLDGAEKHVTTFTPVDILKVEEIPAQLEELFRFKAVVDEQGVLKEQLAQTASQLAAGAPAHQAAAVRQPVSEVNARWARLYGTITDREHKMEKALLQMGHLSEAADQLIAWIDRTGGTLSELTVAGPRNLRAIEIQMCKVAVIRNDVHAHEPSVAALNAAAQRLLKEESNSDTAGKIDRMNEKWRELLKTVDSLATHMETAKSEAENVGGELERWLSWLEDVEVQLATTRPTGGLPETAETQMDDFRVLRAEVEQNGGALDAYIRETERYLMEHGNDKESWVGRSHTQMKTKWNKVKELCVDREKKLQLALQEALSLHASMTATKDWVDMADEKLVNMPPVSRLLEVVEKQIVDHQQWQEEVAERKQLMAEQQAAGTRLQYYCVKSDAIPIKNGLVSLKHRFEKIASRTTERAKQLNIACDEARVWVNGIESLEEWMGQVEGGLAEQPAATSSVSKLKEQLEAVKELHQELAIRQPQFEMTRKRGVALAEHSRAPDAKVINNRNNDMVRRWTALSSMTVERQRAAEQAVLEGDAFEEAMLELEQWVDSELDRINTLDNDKVGGDVDTVRDLKDDEKKFAVERKAKKQGVDTVLRKAKDLADRRVEESASVVAAADRLRDKWSRIEEGVAKRGEALDKAAEEAADFDGKAHAMLDWLTVTENKLKGPTTDISAALAAVNAAKADLDENREKKDSCLAKGREIQGRCHPRADQPLKHWLRVVENRWKEVEERAAEREFSLLEEEQKEQERAESLKQLQKFVAAKKDQLARMTSQPAADDLEILDVMQKEHEEFDAALREKQPDVDAATKGIKKGVRNPAADQLSSEWKQLWLDSLGHQSAMDSQKALLEEMKRLEGWKWEDWKERYVEFNDHGKARVSDLFRRIGRSTTGKVPRDVFIDAIIHSKFPTSRLEMAKVADLFDKGDRMIDSKQFINALRFDMANRTREPVTDHEKINEEIVKQKNSCSCCQQYKIEKISEGHYRFGDTQIKRMVRILRSTVMVRVGGGWEALDEFLSKHDPCRAKGRLNINMFHKDAAPSNAIDTMRAFTKGRHQRVPTTGTPGPIMKIREKTERSLPMFPSSPSSSSLSNRRDRAPSDVSLADSRFGRPSMSNSRSSLLDGGSRPPSRTGSEADSDRPTRIPSLRGKKGTRYNPPSANK